MRWIQVERNFGAREKKKEPPPKKKWEKGEMRSRNCGAPDFVGSQVQSTGSRELRNKLYGVLPFTSILTAPLEYGYRFWVKEVKCNMGSEKESRNNPKR